MRLMSADRSRSTQLLRYLLDVDRRPCLRGADGGEEHRGRLQIVGQGRRGWRASIEPVQELRRDRLVALPDDLDWRHLARLQRPCGASFLDAHRVVAIEHGRAAFALEAVILAVP